MNNNFLKIPGWFSEVEAYSLLEYIKSSSIIVELGSFSGRASTLFSANKKNHCKLYCIDIWEDIGNFYISHNNGNKEFKWDIDNVECLFDHFMKELDHIKIKTLSHIIPNSIQKNSVDLLFVDTCHDSEIVNQEIVSWFDYVKSSGIIAFHDYDIEHDYSYHPLKLKNQFINYRKTVDFICEKYSLKKLNLTETLLITQK